MSIRRAEWSDAPATRNLLQSVAEEMGSRGARIPWFLLAGAVVCLAVCFVSRHFVSILTNGYGYSWTFFFTLRPKGALPGLQIRRGGKVLGRDEGALTLAADHLRFEGKSLTLVISRDRLVELPPPRQALGMVIAPVNLTERRLAGEDISVEFDMVPPDSSFRERYLDWLGQPGSVDEEILPPMDEKPKLRGAHLGLAAMLASIALPVVIGGVRMFGGATSRCLLLWAVLYGCLACVLLFPFPTRARPVSS